MAREVRDAASFRKYELKSGLACTGGPSTGPLTVRTIEQLLPFRRTIY